MANDDATAVPEDSSTSARRWRRVEELFHGARQLDDGGQRRAFLARECGEDQQLRREVESLLEYSDDAATRVGAAVAEAVVATAAGRPDDGEAGAAGASGLRLGDTLGAYRVLEVIGRGGLGTVYLAERDDRQFQMRVAIKVVRREVDSYEIRDRLRQERQILAALDHPNIARIIDGGSTPDGLPYLVMEWIDGEDLESYCARHRLALGERLRLFRQICAAVAYAHGKLVIHRDIKPSNVLVTSTGTVKLLDFGIAKLLEPLPKLAPADPTVAGMQLLTPSFASPEQIRGEALGIATDVYSLGVMLYRLLTGVPPYIVDGARPAAIEKIVCAAPPEKPSAVAGRGGAATVESPARLRRLLAGDLDTIVLKALRKEPQRRYRSAEGLSDDIGRSLAGLPVAARGETTAYIAWKFIGRHRLGVATALAVLLLTLIYAVQLTRQRDRAQLEAAKAEQISQTMIGLFELSDPSQARGETITARELLDRGVPRIRRELADQPEVQATLLDVMGRVYRSLGLYGEAKPLVTDALALRRERLGDDHAEVAGSLNNLAELLYEIGEVEEAEKLFAEALELRRQRLGEEHRQTLDSQNNLAVARYAQGDFEAAEALHRRTLAARRRLLGADHTDVATSLNNLASVFDAGRDYATAEGLYREALAIKIGRYGEVHPDVATARNNLAGMLEAKGDDRGAEILYRQALASNRQLYDASHRDITQGLRRLAVVTVRLGRAAEAVELLREGLAIQQAIEPLPAARLTAIRGELGEALVAAGELEEGAALLRQALAVLRGRYPDGDWRVAVAESRLGACWLAQGEAARARPLLVSGHAFLHAAFGPEHPRTRAARERLEKIDSAVGRQQP